MLSSLELLVNIADTCKSYAMKILQPKDFPFSECLKITLRNSIIILLISNIKKYFRTLLLFLSNHEQKVDSSNSQIRVWDEIAKCDFKHSLSPTTTLFLSCFENKCSLRSKSNYQQFFYKLDFLKSWIAEILKLLGRLD